MSIQHIAKKSGLAIVGRVASEESDVDVKEFKSIHKSLQKALMIFHYISDTDGYRSGSSNPLAINVADALKNSGFYVCTYGAKHDLTTPVYTGMKIVGLLGARANIEVWKISGYTDGKTMIIAHGTEYPLTKLNADFQSNGPITRAFAAYYNANKRS
jgi:hypothetical protein